MTTKPSLKARTNSGAPKVSIGMPVYNGEPFIREALDSLLSQTFTDFEIIISDNASTDETQCICEEFAARDHRVTYFRSARNRGPTNNFQIVLEKASGVFFMWAGADDSWLPNHLEYLLRKHKEKKYILTASSQIHVEIKTKRKFRFKKMSDLMFQGERAKVFESFLALHHWDYAKACLIYGLYRREDMLELTESSNLMEDVGADLLYLYQIIAKGAVGYIETETWVRGERFFRRESVKRNKIVSCARVLMYVFARLFPGIDATNMAKTIGAHSDSIKSTYLSQFEYRPRFYLKHILNELQIASLLMPLKVWQGSKE